MTIYTIEDNIEDVDCTIEFDHSPGRPSSEHDPGEAEYVDLYDVRVAGVSIFNLLSDEHKATAVERCWDHMRDDPNDLF